MKLFRLFALAATLFTASSTVSTAVAQMAADHAKTGAIGTDAEGDLTDGEIRKIDKETGKLTIKHGAIRNLDMPGMTMVFQAKDRALLDTVAVGDKIKFKAALQGEQIVVTEIQPAK